MDTRLRRCFTAAAAVAAAAATLALSACMTVVIEARDGQVRVERGFGVLRVELPAAETAITGAVSGTGIAFTPLGWHIGYARQRWAAMGPQCRAVVWLDGTQLDAASRRWLGTLPQVCPLELASAPCSVDEPCNRGEER